MSNTKNTKALPLPLRVVTAHLRPEIHGPSETGEMICRSIERRADIGGRAQEIANMDSIVRACNGYADAVKALAALVRHLESGKPQPLGSASRSPVLEIAGGLLSQARAVLSGNPLPPDPVRDLVAALKWGLPHAIAASTRADGTVDSVVVRDKITGARAALAMVLDSYHC